MGSMGPHRSEEGLQAERARRRLSLWSRQEVKAWVEGGGEAGDGGRTHSRMI